MFLQPPERQRQLPLTQRHTEIHVLLQQFLLCGSMPYTRTERADGDARGDSCAHVPSSPPHGQTSGGRRGRATGGKVCWFLPQGTQKDGQDTAGQDAEARLPGSEAPGGSSSHGHPWITAVPQEEGGCYFLNKVACGALRQTDRCSLGTPRRVRSGRMLGKGKDRTESSRSWNDYCHRSETGWGAPWPVALRRRGGCLLRCEQSQLRQILCKRQRRAPGSLNP